MLFNSVVFINFVYAWIFSSTKPPSSIVDLYKYFLPLSLIFDLYKYFLLLSLIVYLYKYFLKIMAGIKCIYYLKVCETTCEITKHFSIYKDTMRCTILYQTWYQVFVILQAKATVPLTE